MPFYSKITKNSYRQIRTHKTLHRTNTARSLYSPAEKMRDGFPRSSPTTPLHTDTIFRRSVESFHITACKLIMSTMDTNLPQPEQRTPDTAYITLCSLQRKSTKNSVLSLSIRRRVSRPKSIYRKSRSRDPEIKVQQSQAGRQSDAYGGLCLKLRRGGRYGVDDE